MTAQTPPYAIQASSHGAALFRQAFSSLLGVAQPGTLAAALGGVLQSGDLLVAQNGTPNMSVNVAGGSAWIPQTQAANGGMYFALNDATVNLAISAANATNPRIDTIVATVNDAAYSGASNNWVLQVLTGTPTAGATLSNLNGKAALGASSIVLAYVLVPANATTIVTADLLDERNFITPLLRPTQGGTGTGGGVRAGAFANQPVTMQFGVAAGTTNAGTGILAVNFAEAFPNGVLGIIPMPTGSNPSFFPVIDNCTASGFNLVCWEAQHPNLFDILLNTAIQIAYVAFGF